jgi:Flp pilus assembly protein TadD
MLGRFRIRGRGVVVAMVLLITAMVTGCGEDDSGRTTRRRAARKKMPEVTSRPPVSNAPKADPVNNEVAIKDEEPVTPKVVTYEEAEAAFNKGHYEIATDLYTVYTQNRDQNPWGFYMLGLSAWKAGDHGYAEESFEKALVLAPGHVKSLLNLGRVLLDTDRPDEALARIEEALEIDPRSNVALRLKGRALDQMGRSDEAIETYLEAIEINERDTWSMNNMALILIRQERFEEALPPLARATMIDTTKAIFWNNLGMALERTGHYRLAEKVYGTAFEADDGHDRAYANLVRIQNVDEEPGQETIELEEYAQRFIDEMEGRKFARTGSESSEPTALPDSLTIGMTAPVESDSSAAGPQ